MKILFLDIDDVICTRRSHVSIGKQGKMEKLDPIALGLIDRLLEIQDDVRIVVSSTWRKHHSRKDLMNRFRKEGFKGEYHEDWCTPILPSGFRGDEVKAWLDKHPEVTSYLCIDDGSDFHPDQPLITTPTSTKL